MLNTAILMGRLTSDPELRYTPNDTAVTSFTLAVERSYVKSGTDRQVDFIDVVVWRQTAEFVCKYFHKGQLAAVQGSIQTRSYTDKDGNKRYATEIVANDLKMLGRRGDAPASGADNSYGGSYGGAAQSSQSSPSPSGDIAASAPQEVDDLPF